MLAVGRLLVDVLGVRLTGELLGVRHVDWIDEDVAFGPDWVVAEFNSTFVAGEDAPLSTESECLGLSIEVAFQSLGDVEGDK